MKIDLHVHSSFSDGIFLPEKLVDQAVEQRITVLGLTDHDTIAGVNVALNYAKKNDKNIRIIPGVEISTKISDKYVDNASVHILGYFIDPQNCVLKKKLHDLREIRVHRFCLMKEKLENLGFHVDISVEDARQHSVGRPHLAKSLIRGGYFNTVKEAFDTLLAKNKPAYVSLTTLTQKEAIDLIHQAKGIAFLAHPEEIKSDKSAVSLLEQCDFDGIEIYHPSMRDFAIQTKWLKLAKIYNLKVSGGSDFHGTVGRFPEKLGLFTVDEEKVDGVFCREL